MLNLSPQQQNELRRALYKQAYHERTMRNLTKELIKHMEGFSQEWSKHFDRTWEVHPDQTLWLKERDVLRERLEDAKRRFHGSSLTVASIWRETAEFLEDDKNSSI